MKYIDSYSKDIFENKATEYKFNKLGQFVKEDNEMIFAKQINTPISDNDISSKYYVLTYNNIPYDPYGTDSHREKKLRMSFRATTKQTFDDYISYLKTKNKLYMTRAQRNFIYV